MKKSLILCLIVGLTLTNYKIAKLIQLGLLQWFPHINYELSISVPWILLGLIPSIFSLKQSGLHIDKNLIIKNAAQIGLHYAIVLVGLLLFVVFQITDYFNAVKYPIIFFLFTPIAEELLFRGWMYGKIQRITNYSPILITAFFFCIHHLQYFNYMPTAFAVFQVIYTFFLGLLLGNIRRLSGSIYLSILLHIIINYVTVAM